MNKKLAAALAVSMFVSAFTATAADPAAPTMALEQVVVTATRTPVLESEVLASVTVITREEIQRAQANDLAQLLAMHAGLDIGRNGGPGQPASVFIRGGNSDHTLVLIDGVRVNPATSGPALAMISPDMIERIEIVKGPRSTLYGSDALAGVINIITRGPETPRFDAQVRTGSYGTTDISASHAFGDENARLALTVGKTRSDGFPNFIDATQDRGYDLTTVALRGEATVGEVKLKAQAWRADGSNQYQRGSVAKDCTTYDFAATGYTPCDHDTLNQTAAVAVEYSPLSNWDSRLQFSHTTDQLTENQNSNSLRTIRPELRFDNVVRLGLQRLSVGANIAQDRVNTTSISDVRDLGAAYAQGEFVYGRNHAVVGASFNRYEGFSSEPTFSLEYGLDVWTGGRLVTAYGTGFRAPNATQRFSAFGGDPNLKPERSLSYEAGVQQTLGSHRLDLRAFHNKVKDLIGTDASFNYVNIDFATTEGLELSYLGNFGPLEARLEGVIQKTECSVDASGYDYNSCKAGTRLVRRNARTISGALTYKFTRGYVGVDVFGAADRRDFEGRAPFGTDVKDAGYGLLNASAGVTLGYGFLLALRGENLLGQNYQTANGYRQPGASGYASLRYSFTR